MMMMMMMSTICALALLSAVYVKGESYQTTVNDTRSIQEIWNDVILNASTDGHVFEISIAIASDIVVDGSNSLEMPSFDCNITLDIYCTQPDSLCNVDLNSSPFLRIVPAASPSVYSASKLILRMTGFAFNDNVLQVDNVPDIGVYLTNIAMTGSLFTLAPIFVQYAAQKRDNILSLDSVSFIGSIDAPIHVIDGGQIVLNAIFISECGGGTLIALDNVSQYRLTGIIIVNNDASEAVISIQMASAESEFSNNSDANIAAHIYIDNNTLGSGASIISIVNPAPNTAGGAHLLHNISIVHRTSAASGVTNASPYGVYIAGLDTLFIRNSSIVADPLHALIGVHASDTLYVDVEHSLISMATHGGLIVRGALSVYLNHCQFTHNSVSGNIAPVSLFQTTSYISNCQFSNNKASKSGGAVYIEGGDASISQCFFGQNQAFSGGALSVSNQAVLVINDSAFVDNLAFEGGAIEFNPSIYNLYNNTFVGNRAKTRGGAILDANARLGCELNQTSIVRERNRFIGNAASIGGAIYSTNCKLTITQSAFDGNTAVIMGGALMFDISDVASVASSLIVVSHSVLTNNSCILQGGGAMVMSGGNVRVESSVLQGNRVHDARGIGGAVLVQMLDALSDDKGAAATSPSQSFAMYDCEVAHNQAFNGGGVAVHTVNDNSYPATILRTTIRDNLASNCGAGIYVVDGLVHINESIVADNTAQVCGGALVLEQGTLFSFQNKYANNTANEYGGAIVARSEHFHFDQDAIYNNHALQFGAGLVLSQCPSDPSRNLSLHDNTAAISGGGYFLDQTCEWSTFQVLAGNTASFGDNFATFPERVLFDWSVPSQFTRNDVLSVRAVLVDAYNQTITALAESDQFIMQLSHSVLNTTTDVYNLQWVGAHVSEFDRDDSGDGQTGITFKMMPYKYDDVELEHDQIAHQTAIMFTASIVLNQQAWHASVSTVYNSEMYAIPTWTKVVVHLTVAICIVCIVASFVGIRRCQEEPIVKGARVPFMYIILVGLLFLSVTSSYVVFGHHRGGCALYVWLIVIGLYLTMVSITAKTWAIYLVFSYAENLKEFQWTTKKLALTFVAAPMLVVIIYLSVWTAVDEGMIHTKYHYDAYTQTVVGFCATNPAMSGVPFLLFILAIVVLCFLALRARHVPYNFNEARYLGLCIFTILLCFSVFVAVLYTDFMDPTGEIVLRALCAFALVQSVLASLFYVKFWIVVHGGKVEEIPLEKDSDHNALISQLEPTGTSLQITPRGSSSHLHLKSASLSKWMRVSMTQTSKEGKGNALPQTPPVESAASLGLKLNASTHDYQNVTAVTTPVSPDAADGIGNEEFLELQPLATESTQQANGSEEDN